MIDHLLSGLGPSVTSSSSQFPESAPLNTFGDLAGAADCVVFPEASAVQVKNLSVL